MDDQFVRTHIAANFNRLHHDLDSDLQNVHLKTYNLDARQVSVEFACMRRVKTWSQERGVCTHAACKL